MPSPGTESSAATDVWQIGSDPWQSSYRAPVKKAVLVAPRTPLDLQEYVVSPAAVMTPEEFKAWSLNRKIELSPIEEDGAAPPSVPEMPKSWAEPSIIVDVDVEELRPYQPTGLIGVGSRSLMMTAKVPY